jgi:hypothetical protein
MSAAAQETNVASNLAQGHLLDSLIEKLELKNDAALAKTLEVAPPVISSCATAGCRWAQRSSSRCTK